MTDTPEMLKALKELAFWVAKERNTIPSETVGTIFFCSLITTLVLDLADKGDGLCNELVHKVATDMLKIMTDVKEQRNG